MQHRSFRMTPDPRGRIPVRLRLIYGLVLGVRIMISFVVLGMAALVGTHAEFFDGDVPRWHVLIAYSILVLLAFNAVHYWIDRKLSQFALKWFAPRWMTTQQAEQFPLWADPCPACWYEQDLKKQAESASRSTT